MTDLSRAALRQRLDNSPLAARADAIAKFAEPCVGFSIEKVVDGDLPVGSSKAGGSPDLPSGFEWPEKDGVALTFLLQIRCADLSRFAAAASLPKDGLLSFFYENESQPWGGEPSDKGGWRVAYFPAEATVSRTAPPVEALPSGRLTYSERMSLPDPDEHRMTALELNDGETEAYYEVLESLPSDGSQHQVLGQPNSIQNHVLWEYQHYIGGTTPRRLLLQLDSDDTIDGMWGDVGRLYFLVSDEKLRNRSFDETWMIMQCG